jgi:ABC-2 type transport system ATP-binding protein
MTGPLVVDSLGFEYPGGHGFSGVSFQASSGEIVCIFGRNGSGKTTLLRVLSTLVKPRAGRFSAGGFDASADRDRVRGEIFPVYDTNAHFEHLSGQENLDLFLFFYGVSPPPDAGELAGVFDLDLSRKVSDYSLGMKRKLTLIESFLCSRPVMVFDEPTLGLDSAMRAAFFSRVRRAADGGACIVICTNRIEDTAFATRLFRMENGTLSPVATPDELLAGLIRVTFSFNDHDATEYIPSAGELPDLVKRALAAGIPRKIGIEMPGSAALDNDLWSDEARQKVDRAPRFLRPMITTLVERHARDAGYSRITPDVVDEVRGRFERR